MLNQDYDQAPVFFPAERQFSIAELAEDTKTEIAGGFSDDEFSNIIIYAAKSLSSATIGTVTFASGEQESLLELSQTQASAVFVTPDTVQEVPRTCVPLLTAQPKQSFINLVNMMYPSVHRYDCTVYDQPSCVAHAYVHPEAQLGHNVRIEVGAVIGRGAQIGSDSIIEANAVIGANVCMGRGSRIGSGAVIKCSLIGDGVSIGSNCSCGQSGFGCYPTPQGIKTTPHIGRVIIQNDVEIGSGSCIARGVIDDTVIGENTFVDSLVMIAHNIKIGRHVAIAGHCAMAGSVTIGDRVEMGGRVGVADHVNIGDDVTIFGASGVTKSIPAGQTWGGYPARKIGETKTRNY